MQAACGSTYARKIKGGTQLSKASTNTTLPNRTPTSKDAIGRDCEKPDAEAHSTQRRSPLQRMQRCLDKLGIPLTVAWTPNSNSAKHGEIESGFLIIYDKTETEAWATLEHEVYEWKLREVTCVYRTVINSLIESVEKLTYSRKEAFLESLPHVSEVIRKEKQRPDRSPRIPYASSQRKIKH